MESIIEGDRAMVESRYGWTLRERIDGRWITVGSVNKGHLAEAWLDTPTCSNPA